MNKIDFKLKTAEEIEILARGGAILREVLEKVALMIRPGVTGIELDMAAEKMLREKNAEPAFKGFSSSGDPKDAFPATLCISPNSAVVHGIPNEKPFEEGDIISLDIGCRFEGMYTDTAKTVPVGNISPEAKRLISVTRQALQAGVDAVKPGVKTGDIGAAIQKVADKAGFSIVRELVGHGVGFEVHEAPAVPNYGKKGTGDELPIGTVIAIEPMLNLGKKEIVTSSDGWTVLTEDGSISAHEELTVAVVEGGVRVLTRVK